MKLILTLAIFASAMFTGSSSMAQRPFERSFEGRMEYSAPYRHWNSGFSALYTYEEDDVFCKGRFASATCYDLGPDHVVFIREVRTGNFNRVTVFSDREFKTEVATYHIFDDGFNRSVRSRRWHGHSRFSNASHCRKNFISREGFDFEERWHCDHNDDTVVVQIDFSTAEGKMLTGAVVVVAGLDLLSKANNNVDAGIALGVLASGSISFAAGKKQQDEINKLKRESDLAAAVINAEDASKKENADIGK